MTRVSESRQAGDTTCWCYAPGGLHFYSVRAVDLEVEIPRQRQRGSEPRLMSRVARASASVATADASLASHDEVYTSELLGFSLERLAKVQLPSAFHSAGTDPYSSMAPVLGTCYKYAGARVVARRRGPLAASNPGACSEPVRCLHRGRGVHFCRHEGGCVGGRACAGSTTGAH